MVYFQIQDVSQENVGIAIGSPCSSIMSSIYMEHVENLAFTSAWQKLSAWLWYVDDMLHAHVAQILSRVLGHLNS
jgi:hypothetical protein